MVGEEAALTAPVEFLRAQAPWLFAPGLGTCVVGSAALAAACAAREVRGPVPGDLDLAWALDPAAGEALLREHGVFVATTDGNLERGTLAMKVGGRRLEVTTFRAGSAQAPLDERLVADLGERDMTIGAVALVLATGRLVDPHDGVGDWLAGIVRPVGSAEQRVREHPVRWLRYYRKAHEFGFAIDASIRKLALPPRLLLEVPREAIGGELRSLLRKCASPGRCLLELFEAGLLEALSPELALQFDGRPAGPQRYHPEVSQSLHLILALEWAFRRTQHLDERDALAVRLAVLCHDLGKGYTPARELPKHHGHDRTGLAPIDAFLGRWPGLADQRTRTLARQVCAMHLHVHRFGELKPGTLAGLYDEWLRGEFALELFALAIAADAAGRLGLEYEGDVVLEQVRRDIAWLRAACSSVDAAALRAAHPDDVPAFRAALHEARARALRTTPRPATSPGS